MFRGLDNKVHKIIIPTLSHTGVRHFSSHRRSILDFNGNMHRNRLPHVRTITTPITLVNIIDNLKSIIDNTYIYPEHITR